jgi:hypothetical protein
MQGKTPPKRPFASLLEYSIYLPQQREQRNTTPLLPQANESPSP